MRVNMKTNTALVLGVLSLLLLAGSIIPIAHAANIAHAAATNASTSTAQPAANGVTSTQVGTQQEGDYQGMFGNQTAPDSGPGSELVDFEIDG